MGATRDFDKWLREGCTKANPEEDRRAGSFDKWLKGRGRDNRWTAMLVKVPIGFFKRIFK